MTGRTFEKTSDQIRNVRDLGLIQSRKAGQCQNRSAPSFGCRQLPELIRPRAVQLVKRLGKMDLGLHPVRRQVGLQLIPLFDANNEQMMQVVAKIRYKLSAR